MISRLQLLCLLVLCLAQVSCKMFQTNSGPFVAGPDTPPDAVIKNGIVVTLRDQKLTYFQDGKAVMDYPISSSKFGISTQKGSHCTPLGLHAVSEKTGEGQPVGMVFKGGRPTGEVVGVDATGRDPIVTRVVKLTGLEKGNRNSLKRGIFLHGTPEERYIGSPASYGCIRMKSKDIVSLYPYLSRGMTVAIEPCSQNMYKDCVTRTFNPAPASPAPPAGSSPTPDNGVAASPEATPSPEQPGKKTSPTVKIASPKSNKGRKAKA